MSSYPPESGNPADTPTPLYDATRAETTEPDAVDGVYSLPQSSFAPPLSSYAPPVPDDAAPVDDAPPAYTPPAYIPPVSGAPASDDGPASDAGSTASQAKDEAASVASDAKGAAQNVAGVTKDQAKQVGAEVKSQASELFGQAKTQLQEQAGTQQKRVAEGLRAVSDELTSMADSSENSGLASELVRNVSGRAGSVATWLDDRDPGSLLDEVKQFAARRPGAFIAIAAGAGILAGRLTKSLTSVAKDEAAATGGEQ
jgi:hypothetical protein